MEIKIAKHAGFCFGVKKAIEIAEDVSRKNPKTYVFGQLVHNERVIKKLEEKGIIFSDELKDIPKNAITVLRAHGEPKTTYEVLEKKEIIKGKNLFDATCPLVTLVHNVAIKLKKSGFEVILFGKKNHPEAIGTSYHLRGQNTIIVEEPTQYRIILDFIKKNPEVKVAIISQTTMSVDGYADLIKNVNSRLKGIEFENVSLNMADMSKKYCFVDTICNPTKQRQSDTEVLAKECDIVIVIGGKNSSNSKELYAKCKSYGVESYFIQSADQIKKDWFKGKKKAGITAGASTPDDLIKEVAEKIRDYEV